MPKSLQCALSPEMIVRLQATQDALANLSGLSLCIVDGDGRPCTVASNVPAVCFPARGRSEASSACVQAVQHAIGEASTALRPAVFHCPSGLTCAIIPLGVGWNDAPCSPTFFLYAGRVQLTERREWDLPPITHSPLPAATAAHRSLSRSAFMAALEAVGEVFNLLFIMAAAGGMAPQSPALPDGGVDAGTLTRREREIIRLVGIGLDNKSIGARLFISERTVKTHITNVLRKLNLSNRTELALYAVQALGKN